MATSRIYDVPNGRGFAREESRRVPAVLGPAADPLRQLHAPETDQRLAVIVGAHVAPAPSNDIDVDAICAGRFNADTDKVFGLNRPGYITVHGFAVLLGRPRESTQACACGSAPACFCPRIADTYTPHTQACAPARARSPACV